MTTPSDDRDEPGRRYRSGLPDHHDPTSRIGGAPRALSALTLRAVLAAFGVVVSAVLAVAFAAADGPVWLVVVMVVLSVVAAVDLVLVLRRKRRGEPG